MEGGTYVSLNKANNQCRQKEKNSYLWWGTVTGAVVGTMSGIFLDTWKAVFCAIAGSAVVIYGVTSLHKTKQRKKRAYLVHRYSGICEYCENGVRKD